jgi:hypothetical protein
LDITDTWNLQDVGFFYQIALLDSVEPYTLALFKRVLGYTKEEVEIVMAQVRREICEAKKMKMHMYVQLYFVYGRKP